MPALPVLPQLVTDLLGVTGARVEFGDNGINAMVYAAGNHYYQGQGGVDTITGGLGNDYIEGGAGGDIILADLGLGPNTNDTLGYFNSAAGVNVTLNALGGFDLTGVGVPSGGDAQGDKVAAGFENLVGSQFNDVLTGNANNNKLIGMGGNDTLNGGGGNDTLWGGDGEDTLNGGAGADVFRGGTGERDEQFGGGGADLFFGEVVENPAGHSQQFEADHYYLGQFDRAADVVRYENWRTSRDWSSYSDTILDFEKGIDKLDLSQIDANSTIAGNQSFTIVDELLVHAEEIGDFAGADLKAGELTLFHLTLSSNTGRSGQSTVIVGEIDGVEYSDGDDSADRWDIYITIDGLVVNSPLTQITPADIVL